MSARESRALEEEEEGASVAPITKPSVLTDESWESRASVLPNNSVERSCSLDWSASWRAFLARLSSPDERYLRLREAEGSEEAIEREGRGEERAKQEEEQKGQEEGAPIMQTCGHERRADKAPRKGETFAWAWWRMSVTSASARRFGALNQQWYCGGRDHPCRGSAQLRLRANSDTFQ